MRKYGKDAFEWSVLETTDNLNELYDLELNWCLFLNTFAPNGYNIAIPGPAPMLGRKHTEESKKKMSMVKKGKGCGEENPMFGVRAEKHPNYLELNDDRIIKLYVNHGYGVPKIAKTMNCSNKAVYNHLRFNNIKIKNNLFGFVGCHLENKKRIIEGKLNPWTKVWRSEIRYKTHRTILGLYNDPLSCEIVYNLVKEELEA